MTIGLLEVGEGARWRAAVGAAIGNTTCPGGRNDTSSSLSSAFYCWALAVLDSARR